MIIILWCGCRRYLQRFRHAAPLSREQRQKMSAADAREFWWLRDKDTSTSTDQSVTEPLDSRPDKTVSRYLFTYYCL